MRTNSLNRRGVLSDGVVLLLAGSAIVAAIIFFVYILVYDEEERVALVIELGLGVSVVVARLVWDVIRARKRSWNERRSKADFPISTPN